MTRGTLPQPADILGLPRGRRRALLSLAPLIDVTFILLIFFMLVTQFTRLAPIEVTLGSAPDVIEQPKSAEGAAAARETTVLIHADGSLQVQGQPLAGAAALGEALQARWRALSRMADGEGEPLILVKPDADVPLQLLIDVLVVVENVPQMPLRLVVPKERKDTP